MSIMSLAARTIDATGFRRTPAGRRVIASLNILGQKTLRFLYLRGGGPFMVDGHWMFLSDHRAPSVAFVSSVIHNQYEPDTKGLLQSLIGEHMIVFDVGAHVGHYTLLAARLVGPRGHVYAFEAEPENYSLLVKNVELNGYRNVTCIQKAISSCAGSLTLFASSQGNDRHSIIDQGNPTGTTKIDVAAISLDEFASSMGLRSIDVIKMDIEGAEPLALAGMSKVIEQSSQLSIVMEFAPEILRSGGTDPAGFLQYLTTAGLSIAPVEGDIPRDLFHPDRFDDLVSYADGRGAVNFFCSKGSSI